MVTDLRQVALHVEDVDRAVAFYRDVVGLDLIARFDQAGVEIESAPRDSHRRGRTVRTARRG